MALLETDYIFSICNEFYEFRGNFSPENVGESVMGMTHFRKKVVWPSLTDSSMYPSSSENCRSEPDAEERGVPLLLRVVAKGFRQVSVQENIEIYTGAWCIHFPNTIQTIQVIYVRVGPCTVSLKNRRGDT